MQYTIRISFDQADDCYSGSTSVYQVRLASEDPSSDSYGVKDLDTGLAVVPWGTVVSVNADGSYSYTFTVENGHLYNVSW